MLSGLPRQSLILKSLLACHGSTSSCVGTAYLPHLCDGCTHRRGVASLNQVPGRSLPAGDSFFHSEARQYHLWGQGYCQHWCGRRGYNMIVQLAQSRACLPNPRGPVVSLCCEQGQQGGLQSRHRVGQRLETSRFRTCCGKFLTQSDTAIGHSAQDAISARYTIDVK